MPAISVMKADLPGGPLPEHAEQEHGGDRRRDVGDELVDALEDGGVVAEQRRADDGEDGADARWSSCR